MIEYQYFKIEKTVDRWQFSGQREFEFANIEGGKADGKGVYSWWEWDGTALKAGNDFFGYYPLFYYSDEKQFVISDSLVKLISVGIEDEYDEEALQVFIRCGFFLGESTPFKNIKVLPPNAHLCWQDGKLDVAGGETIVTEETISDISDNYIDLFRESVEAYGCDKDFGVFLSGGKDSRQILFELLKQGKKPSLAVSCGEYRDRKVASEIAQATDLNWICVPPEPNLKNDTLTKNVLTHFCALEHGWFLPMAKSCAQKFDLAYEGTGVSLITKSEFLEQPIMELYEQGDYESVASSLFNKLSPNEKVLKSLKKFPFLADEDSAIKCISEKMKSYKEAVNPLALFSFWNWNRRAIALSPFGLQSGFGCKCLTPFLDKKLYNLVASASIESLSKVEPQAEAIAKAYPDYANIVYYDEVEKQKDRKKISASVINSLNRILSLIEIAPKYLCFGIKIMLNKGMPHRSKTLDVMAFLLQLDYIRKPKNARKVLKKLKIG